MNMDKDRVKGKMKDMTGKAQEKMGRAIGSKEQEAKGLGKQVEGRTQNAWGNVKDAGRDVAEDLKRAGRNVAEDMRKRKTSDVQPDRDREIGKDDIEEAA